LANCASYADIACVTKGLSIRTIRPVIALAALATYAVGISQLLPAVLGPEAGVAESGCPTVTSCAVTAAYGPCCCLTSTTPAGDSPGLMAVGCALPDDHGTGILSLPTHTVFPVVLQSPPERLSLAGWLRGPVARSILLSPADEVPRLVA